MKQREMQTEWFVDLIEEHRNGRDIKILGKFERNKYLTGSPSILLKNILEEKGHEVSMWDVHTDDDSDNETESQLYFIGTKHPEFTSFPFIKNSTIIDPWRYIPDVEGCEVIRVGDRL